MVILYLWKFILYTVGNGLFRRMCVSDGISVFVGQPILRRNFMILISVFDKKASYFHPPLAYDHVTQAIRSYMAFARQKPDSQQIAFSEDFDLYQVGDFNSVSGVVTPLIPPNYVESLTTIVREAQKSPFNGEVNRG